MSILNGIKNKIKSEITRINTEKIFCIGRNKTGTTSLKIALEDLGYKIGDQATAELFLQDYKKRNFVNIIDYCHTAEAFQDIPFSLPYTFIPLDHAFPGSKFILTVRDSAEEWYDSIIRFQAEKHGGGELPTKEVLQNTTYRYKGFAWETKKIVFNTPDDDIYNKEMFIEHYKYHNKMVKDYFRFRPDDLLILNLKDDNAYQKLCKFLDRKPLYDNFPWVNKTESVNQ